MKSLAVKFKDGSLWTLRPVLKVTEGPEFLVVELLDSQGGWEDGDTVKLPVCNLLWWRYSTEEAV